MYIELKNGNTDWLLMLLLFSVVFDATAATRNQCRQNMVATEVQELNFGNYVGTIGGTITVDTNGVRTSSAPITEGSSN